MPGACSVVTTDLMIMMSTLGLAASGPRRAAPAIKGHRKNAQVGLGLCDVENRPNLLPLPA